MDLLKPLAPGARGLSLVAVAVLAACGSPGSGVNGEVSPGEPPSEGAVRPSDPGAGTPERAASEHLVREGVAQLAAGRAGEAARTLERALQVDPSHGLAYYHLARVRLEQGRVEEAEGLLERAVDLLAPYPEARERARRLRDSIRGRTG